MVEVITATQELLPAIAASVPATRQQIAQRARQIIRSYLPTTGHRPVNILRLPEVMARVGLCRASIYGQIARGTFPKQITLGPRAVGWFEHEVEAWLASKIGLR